MILAPAGLFGQGANVVSSPAVVPTRKLVLQGLGPAGLAGQGANVVSNPAVVPTRKLVLRGLGPAGLEAWRPGGLEAGRLRVGGLLIVEC